MIDDLKEYQKAVEEYAKSGSNYLLHNKGPQHAQIIFDNIFRNAQNEVRIAAGSLCNEELVNQSPYIEAVDAFIKKDSTKLYILLSQFPAEAKEIDKDKCLLRFLSESQAYKDGRVIVKDMHGKGFKSVDKSTNAIKDIHFCTADGRMYRLETDVEERAAICNFGDSDRVSELNRLFDSAFETFGQSVNLSEKFKTENFNAD